MHISPYEQIRQIIEKNNHEVDVLIQQGQAIKVYKRNHEKEIISFQYPGIPQRLLLKFAYVKGNRIQRFFRSWEKSLCEKEFKNTHLFKEKGFAVPDPILYGQKRRLGMLQKGYYLAYEVPDSILLTDYIAPLDNKRKADHSISTAETIFCQRSQNMISSKSAIFVKNSSMNLWL